MKRALVVFGTRPEAIKMCPLALELKRRIGFETRICVSGQHREMLDQVLERFGVTPDYDLNIMQHGQTLADVTSKVLQGMTGVLTGFSPDVVFVHGDTSTAYSTALAAFYLGIPVAHVEAGLRTYNMSAPFPEEFNRQAIGIMASFHFAPTELAQANLLKEGKDPTRIFVTGNTAIDALMLLVSDSYQSELTEWAKGSRLLLVTAHRRENLGKPLNSMLSAIRRIVDEYPDVKVIYPVHPNPAVWDTAQKILSDHERICLIEPMDAFDFQNLMNHAYLLLSDSGGVQEEAPALGKPVLVMRDTTERPEGVQAGTLLLVGTQEESICTACRMLLDDQEAYRRMSQAKNPYGDGTASRKIVDVMEREL